MRLFVVFFLFLVKCYTVEPNGDPNCDGDPSVCKANILDGGWRLSEDPTMQALSLQRCDIPRIDGRKIKWQEFSNTYLNKEPVIITGLMDDWPAQTRWQKQSLISLYGSSYTPYQTMNELAQYGPSRGEYEMASQILLKKFVEEILPAGGFIFNQQTHANSLSLQVKSDVIIPDLIKKIVPDMEVFFSLGSEKTGAPFHTHSDNICSIIYGQKRWYLYAPEAMPASVYKQVALGTTYKWISSKNYSDIPKDFQPLECTQNANELLYIPRFWHHSTVNIGETVAMGFQHGDNHLSKFELQEAILHSPRVPLLYTLLSHRIEDVDEKIKLLNIRLELEPFHMELRFNIAKLLVQKNEIKKCEALLIETAQLLKDAILNDLISEKEATPHWAYMSAFYLNSFPQPQTTLADRFADLTLEGNNQNVGALVSKAVIRLFAKDPYGANEFVNKALAIDPTYHLAQELKKEMKSMPGMSNPTPPKPKKKKKREFKRRRGKQSRKKRR